MSNVKDIKEVITPEHAVLIFKRHGIKLNNEQARNILDFMAKIAKLVVDQYDK
jgi:hypothetical protein